MQFKEPHHDQITEDPGEPGLSSPTPVTATGAEKKVRGPSAGLNPVFTGTAIVLSVIFFTWLFGSFMPGCNTQVGDWINGHFNKPKPKEPSVLDKLIEDRKSSQTLELDADRAEYEGRLEEAVKLREKAAQRRSEENVKAAQDSDFQEWRRKKYGLDAVDDSRLRLNPITIPSR